jgi:hypothetical protein
LHTLSFQGGNFYSARHPRAHRITFILTCISFAPSLVCVVRMCLRRVRGINLTYHIPPMSTKTQKIVLKSYIFSGKDYKFFTYSTIFMWFMEMKALPKESAYLTYIGNKSAYISIMHLFIPFLPYIGLNRLWNTFWKSRVNIVKR